ncbi:efflux RND transporter periplasmic adaptor subunit [Kiritimatiellota bacterium B12222]|nr:efflux RND transporter periplasmic adaptor subunit [Kiritimatiellota bacterium B12222]
MTSSQLDSLKRRPQAASDSRRSTSRSWLVLPLLFLGFALVSVLLFGERLRPRLTVQTAPALLLEGGGSDTTTTSVVSQTLSQASGWIEPDPYPIRVPVKVDGLVETVHVLAGENVEAGQLLATLDATDFEYHLQALQGRLLAAQAMQTEKEKALERAASECRRSQAGIAAAEARYREQQDRYRRLLALDPGVVPEDERLQVEREVAVGKAELAAAQAEWEGHMAHQGVEKAAIETAKARVLELQAELAQAETNVARTEIRSPVAGVVMKRYASPGGKRMLGMDDADSATIVSLYDPSKLQIRVDVPLSDASSLQVGMPARIQLSPFPDREFKGKVTRIVGEADIVRNTLQVKVAILDPDARMRPEMLCRVEFFSLPTLGSAEESAFRPSEKVWIPQAAVQEGNQVWVVDPVSMRAELRMLEIGSEVREEYVSVREGLRPGERVIVGQPDGLKVGSRVKENQGDRR